MTELTVAEMMQTIKAVRAKQTLKIKPTNLSFEQKIDIVVRLQHVVSAFHKSIGVEAKKPWWPIDENGKRISQASEQSEG